MKLGSLHERLGWRGVIAPAICFFVFISYALIHLYKVKQTRSSALWLFAGFAILATVPVQEFIEHSYQWNTPLIQALRVISEEGSELIGFLLLLIGIVNQHKLKKGYTFLVIIPDLRRVPGLDLFLILGLIFNITICWFVLDQLTDMPRRGNPALWYPMVVSLIMTCQAIWMFVCVNTKVKKLWLIVALFFLIASAGIIADLFILIPKITQFNHGELTPRMVTTVFFLCMALACALIASGYHWQRKAMLPIVILVILGYVALTFSNIGASIAALSGFIFILGQLIWRPLVKEANLSS